LRAVPPGGLGYAGDRVSEKPAHGLVGDAHRPQVARSNGGAKVVGEVGKPSVANLTPLTTYGFRVAVTSSSGIMGEWSPIVSLLVH
jgi:hypothetical protein